MQKYQFAITTYSVLPSLAILSPQTWTWLGLSLIGLVRPVKSWPPVAQCQLFVYIKSETHLSHCKSTCNSSRVQIVSQQSNPFNWVSLCASMCIHTHSHHANVCLLRFTQSPHKCAHHSFSNPFNVSSIDLTRSEASIVKTSQEWHAVQELTAKHKNWKIYSKAHPQSKTRYFQCSIQSGLRQSFATKPQIQSGLRSWKNEGNLFSNFNRRTFKLVRLVVWAFIHAIGPQVQKIGGLKQGLTQASRSCKKTGPNKLKRVRISTADWLESGLSNLQSRGLGLLTNPAGKTTI